MLTAVEVYACHAVQKPKQFFKRGWGGGVGWGEGLTGSLTMVTHILVNPIYYVIKRYFM